MARTVAQVKTAPQLFIFLFLPYLSQNGPNKSTPVTENGGENIFNLSGGRSAIRVEYGYWRRLRQVTQSFTTFVTKFLPRRIQNFLRVLHRVRSRPAWSTRLWESRTINLEMSCDLLVTKLDGLRRGSTVIGLLCLQHELFSRSRRVLALYISLSSLPTHVVLL